MMTLAAARRPRYLAFRRHITFWSTFHTCCGTATAAPHRRCATVRCTHNRLLPRPNVPLATRLRQPRNNILWRALRWHHNGAAAAGSVRRTLPTRTR
jgi:hypothetical protein